MMYQRDDRVQVTSVDMDGLCGRDPHPTKLEVGMQGRVLDHTQTLTEDGADPIEIYEVHLDDGNIFEFADYELESA